MHGVVSLSSMEVVAKACRTDCPHFVGSWNRRGSSLCGMVNQRA